MTLEDIQSLVDGGHYHYSEKVRELIEDGFYSEDDLECCIRSASRIYKSERDERGVSVDGMKHVIIGRDTCGQPFYTTGKVISMVDGPTYFFITAHECE